MTTQVAESHVTHLCRYAIASSDMYYAEMEQRDVFLYYDEQGNFHICGEMADEGSSNSVDLFEIFLEYGLYCCTWCDMGEALYHMQNFGDGIGKSLATHLRDIIPSHELEDSASQLLKHIFETLDVSLSMENIGSEVRLSIADYPLTKAAKHSGLRNVELAHHGINSMCQSLVHGINPNIDLNASCDTCSEFIFTISASRLS